MLSKNVMKVEFSPAYDADIADQLNLSVAFNCSANSQPTKSTEELSWLTISLDRLIALLKERYL